MSRHIGDLQLARARRVEEERRLEMKRKAIEDSRSQLRIWWQTQMKVREYERKRQLKLQAEAEIMENARKEEERAKQEMEKERLQREQNARDFCASLNVMVGQMAFLTRPQWDQAVDVFCCKVEQAKTKMQTRLLADSEKRHLGLYRLWFAESGAKDMAGFRVFLCQYYDQARKRFFDGMLKGSGSTLQSWTAFF